MGDTCSLLSVRRSAISLCSYEIYDYINYDYLVLNMLIEILAFLAYVANLHLLLINVTWLIIMFKMINNSC
jgi:hypothetical protein